METHKEAEIPHGPEGPRLIVVSNRLPITIKKDSKGKGYTLTPSSGGLVSGMAGCLKDRKYKWYGWPGLQLPPEEVNAVSAQLEEKHNARPIFLPDKLADLHYNGFSNEILWPLVHYHPGEATFEQTTYDAYETVNHIFAERIIDGLQDGDIVWVHDYHLMLLPLFLRQKAAEKGLNVKIGFFLHTPFPSAETYRNLPCRVLVLEGLLAADLVGFHTHDYAKHFIYACHLLLKATMGTKFVELNNRKTAIGSFPIGIDPEKFAASLVDPKTEMYLARYQEHFKGVTTIIGCDRLDYIKGIPHKLHAFQHLLETYPELIGKVKLVQIAVPSREDVPEYQALKRRINELAGLINATYGTIDFNPVHLKHTSCGQEELTALFAVSDICLVSSTRDGMNLVAYEYVACQAENHGVLVLSEFAGCAQSFAGGAIVCNPWNTGQLADALLEAIVMNDAEKSERHQCLWNYIHRYTSKWWGREFLAMLDEVTAQASGELEIHPMDMSRKLIIEAIDREKGSIPHVPRKKLTPKKKAVDTPHL
ncbi:hypothetical protein KVT40_002771 [Elsinoe batatas]|uniref:Trehalose-6-phosphate synthase n=1 Tax=Elsinoe batatas TaxID=2601811 RepID=A0A8K0PGF2_9PEZI|nr:hypothetical protein KVT40_002771 [Elsinoe batatas]